MERVKPVRDVEYLESLADAVRKGVDYGIAVLGVGDRALEAPLAVITQARLGARHRIPLEMVIQRYLAANLLLAEFVLEEAAESAICSPALIRSAMAAQGAAFEQLVAVITEEYRREAQSQPTSHEARQVERARRLLSGELIDPLPLDYELDGHHLGLLAGTPDARPLIRRLADEIGGRCLVLTPSCEELWAWLGSSRGPIDPKVVRDWIAAEGSSALPLGMGEPKSGRDGWRLTHEQARAAVWIAEARSAPVVEYTEAALLASMGRDTILTTSLQERYLTPLASARGGGQVLRTTLRTYFRTDRNCSSAAAALGVSRQTVANRLAAVEECLGQPLGECAEALYAALSLEELGRLPDPHDPLP